MISLSGWITLAVLVAAIVVFVGGWLAPEIVALLAAGILIATRVLEPGQALAGFGSPALITLVGMFVLSEGLLHSGAPRSPARAARLAPHPLAAASCGPAGQRRLRQSRLRRIPPVLVHGHRPAGVVERQPLLYLLLASRFLPDRGLNGGGTLTELTRQGYLTEVVDLAGTLLDAPENDDPSAIAKGIRLTEVLLPGGSKLAGTTLRDLRFRQRFNATVLAVKRANTTLQDRLPSTPSAACRRTASSWCSTNWRTTLLAVLLVSGLGLISLVAAVLLAVGVLVIGGCLDASSALSAIRLDVYLLLGGLFSFSAALQQGGLAQLAADALLIRGSSPGRSMAPWWRFTPSRWWAPNCSASGPPCCCCCRWWPGWPKGCTSLP
ncbi:SLC13 family permease [Synechococcus sp. CS-1328]|uniref:SLC13 family permease n=1 Tax=Synechococcus sp. CS-1328 TaxID=2847976 RepID=UPI0037D9D6D1